MLRAATRYLREQFRRRGELIPVGLTWASLLAVDVSHVGGGVIAILQRPSADLPVGLAAFAVSIAPTLVFFFLNTKLSPVLMWATWSTATAMMLFGTSTPIHADFAPALLVLMVLSIATLSSIAGGFLAATSAAALLLAASALHRLDAVVLYLAFVGAGWLLGYVMRTQRLLLAEQIEAQKMLAEHAAADERRRIAREVHDVIAHSLSITLLHVTGARRGLQQDRDVDDAVEALEQAERLGRQAMADIRRTVGLLDSSPTKSAQTTPEPGIDDVGVLVADFQRAGLDVTLRIDGATGRASAAVGLALFRITQESLTNIAKHAPDSKSTVALNVSASSASLTVDNRLPVAIAAPHSAEGRGLRGMRQRVELLGGAIDAGPTDDGWSVRADIPLHEGDTGWRPWWCKL
ncbi:sensor histidine kinase [Mycobacterium nebraskense]|uniref:histidine kinase n=1 Tax=Mycobacterium nebraskense TaxID=244292 RepID=A0A1X1Z836_9MYCO|nr:histidine kinase [Mycobacterium nebraskense]KKC06093.1 histidine kinase [Mycobacterium nebraskense]MBI2696960.1 two-component sensor histidine kinase [Mycobacterium nebraskense]MCV7118028.1 two-component sensor histidine kinase [Mycobacterium nebraskense]ORW19418.1 histidine kinase [Mycobacterium nebraskense]